MSERTKKGFYARVMGTFWRHPRTCGLSLQARGLWVSMLSWCADQLSDGVVPDAALMLIAGGAPPRKQLDELSAAGLLERDDAAKAWRLREWADHNITREKYEKEKERARNGMAKARDVTRNIEVTGSAVTSNKPVSYRPPSDQDQDQDQEQEQSLTSVSDTQTRARPVTTLVDTGRIEVARRAIQAGYQTRRKAVPGRIATTAPSHGDACKLAGLGALPPDDLVAIIDGFFDDEAMRVEGYPVGYLLANPNEWGRSALDAARDDGHSRERPAVQEIPPWARTEVGHG
jgi:hypothetical protein